MEQLQSKLGYHFQNIGLLKTALTHSSYANEHREEGVPYNERLEFLGDSVLGFLTAEYLYSLLPAIPEGKMSRLRAELVCEASLVKVADELELAGLLRLGKGEERGGGRNRTSIKADAVEAVLAALYLDGGMEQAKRFVNTYILSRMEAVKTDNRDYKTELQELLQKDGAVKIEYRLIGESGPDHDKRFEMAVFCEDKEIGRGTGKSKKAAEQAAACAALGAGK